jgi:hypothetical protein
MRLILSLILFAVPVGSSATPPVPFSGPMTVAGEPGDTDCFGYVIWEQLPDGVAAISSQYDVCYPFTSEVADDFTGEIGVGTDGYGISWWGSYWNGSATSPPDGFTIRFYADDSGMPGDLVHEETVTDYHEVDGSPNGYCAFIEASLGLARYHVAIQADLCFPPQWGVATGVGNGDEAHFRGELFGFPDWTPVSEAGQDGPYELALQVRKFQGHWDLLGCCYPDGTCRDELVGSVCEGRGGTVVDDCEACGATPTRRTTFGQIKSWYR